MGKAKLVLLGLDGAEWGVIDPLISAGCLPNFKRMKESGSHAPLASSTPPLSPPAWTSIFTGANPGKHGIFNFANTPGKLVTTFDVKLPFFWELMAEHRVLVFNAPFTYPPRPSANCNWVAGFNTPTSDSQFTHPRGLREEIRGVCPGYSIHFGYDLGKRVARRKAGKMHHDYVESRTPEDFEEQLISEILHSFSMRESVARHLMARKPWDMAVIAFSEPDWLQHDLMGRFMDAEDKSATGIARLYMRIDAFLGELLDAGHNVIIVSDHGFLRIDRLLFLNTFLQKEGYLRLKPSPGLWRFAGRFLRTLAFSTFMAMPAALIEQLKKIRPVRGAGYKLIVDSTDDAIDASASSAYLAGISGGVMVRDPRDLPALAEKLEALRDESGMKLLQFAKRREDIYSGPELAAAAPLQVLPARGVFLSKGLPGRLTRPIDPRTDKTGGHSPFGVLLAAGPDIPPAALENASVNDIAPTILSLLSYPVPPYMDGRPLLEGGPRKRAGLKLRTRQALVMLRRGKRGRG